MNDNLYNVLLYSQIVVSLLLIISIILQNRAEGMGGLIPGGGGGEVFRTKRGIEKFLYYATIVLIVAFATLSMVLVKFN